MIRIKIKAEPEIVYGESGKGLNQKERWCFVTLCAMYKKSGGEDGWLETRSRDIREMCGMKRKAIWLARKSLVKAGLIEEG